MNDALNARRAEEKKFPWNEHHAVQDVAAGLCTCGRKYLGRGRSYGATRLQEHVDFWTPIKSLEPGHPLRAMYDAQRAV